MVKKKYNFILILSFVFVLFAIQNVQGDTTVPNVTLISPSNNTITTNTSINFTSDLSDETGLANYTLYIYNSSDNTLVNETFIDLPSNPLTTTVGVVVDLATGIYNWFYTVFDTSGNSATSENNTLEIQDGDITPPVMEITFPVESTLYNPTTFTGVTLNYDDAVTCEYSPDNSTWTEFTSCTDTTNYNLTDGVDQILYVRGKDSVDNYGYATPVTFSYDSILPTIEITFPIESTLYNPTTFPQTDGNSVSSITFTYSETGSGTCELSSDNVTWTTFTNCDTMTWTSLTFPNEGNNTLYLKITDTAGNIGYATPVTFTWDSISPTMEIIYPVISTTYGPETWTLINITYEDSVTCEFSLDNSGWTSFTSCDDTSNFDPTTLLSQGSNTLYIRGTDTAGNYGYATEINFNWDSIAPSMEITFPPGENQHFNAETWTGIAFSYDDAVVCEYSIDGGGWVEFTACDNTSNFEPPEGQQFSLDIKGTDVAGNHGETYLTMIHYDSILPTITISFPVESTTYNLETLTGVSLDCLDVSLMVCEYSMDNSTWTLSSSCDNQQNIVSLNVSEGSNTIYAKVTDESNNIGYATPVTFTYDTIPPVMEITFPVESDGYNAGTYTYVEFKLNYDDAVTCEYSIDNSTWAAFSSCTDTTNTGSFMLSEGNNTYYARGIDSTNNYGYATPVTFTYDSIPPTMTITYPAQSSTYGPNTWTGATITYDDAVTCEYSEDNSGWTSFTSCDDTSNYVPSSDGQVNLYVRGTDSNGNIGYASEINFYWDSSAPTVTITGVEQGVTYSAATYPGVSCGGDAVSCEFSTDASSWVSSYPTPSEGDNLVFARGYDEVNNIGYADSSVTHFYYDTTPPTVTIEGVVQSTTYSESTYPGVSCGGDAISCEYSVDENNWMSSYSPTEGINYVYIRGYDEVNNIGYPGNNGLTFTYDTTAPTVTITGVTQSSSYNLADYPGVSCGGDAVYCEYSLGAPPNWYSSYPAPSEGSNEVHVRGYDEVNNIGYAADNGLTFWYDGIAPVISEIYFPLDSGNYNLATWTGISFNYDDAVSCEYTIDSAANWYSFTACDNTSNFIPDSSFTTIIVRGTDSAGNTGLNDGNGWKGAGSITYDDKKFINDNVIIDFSQSISIFNVSNYIQISNNFISVDSISQPTLNVSANITFNNLRTDFINPVILKDGLYCTDCVNYTDLNAGNVTFGVTGFSNYTIGEENLSINLISPSTNTNTQDKSINFTANMSDNLGISNYTVYIYNSTNDLVNETTVLTPSNPIEATVGIVVMLVDNIYHWFYTMFGVSGNSITSENNTLTIFTLSITRNHQIPADLTSLNAVNTPLNITMNISHSNPLNLSTISYNYKVNATNRISTFINGTDRSSIFNIEKFYISNISNQFLFYGDDNDVYPATYNLQEENLEDTVHNARLLAGSNSYFSVELLNVSNKTQYNFFEVMAINATAASNVLRVYYCNSTYVTGNPSTSTNCVNIGSVARGAYNHCHDEHIPTYSCHQVIPYTINTTTGRIGTVKVTPTSRFVLRGSTGGDWNVYSVPTVTRVGAMKSSTNSGNAWTNLSYTFDSHTHQYDGTDTFYYYVCANDTSGNSACSPVYEDLINLGGLPPQPGIITHPVAENYELGLMNINYTAFESPNAYSITKYNISLHNAIDHSFNKSIISDNGVNLGYIWNTTDTTPGEYVIYVTGCDSNSLCSDVISDEFNLTSGIIPTSITSITSPSSITLTGATTKTEYIQFNTTGNVNASSAQIILTKGVESRTSTSCNNISNEFNCSITFEFYDSSGLWDINASIRDDLNVLYTKGGMTTINELNYVTQDIEELNWTTIYAGQNNTQASIPLILFNKGNQNYNNISIKSQNATGILYSNIISGNNFKVDNITSSTSGNSLAENSYVQITKLNLNNHGSSINQSIYFYVDTPLNLKSDTYNSVSNWNIKCLA